MKKYFPTQNLISPLSILYIGARGQLPKPWSKHCHSVKIDSFDVELTPQESHHLGSIGAHHNTIISEKNGRVDFNLTAYREASSLLNPNYDLLKEFYFHDEYIVEKVLQTKATTIETHMTKHNIHAYDFAILDAQGAEWQILKSGASMLQHCLGMQIEVEFVPLYQDQKLFTDIDQVIQKNSFLVPYDINPSYVKYETTQLASNTKGRLIYADMLYLIPPERLCSFISQYPEDRRPELIKKVFALANIYGYYDYCNRILDDSTLSLLLANDASKYKAFSQRQSRKNLAFFIHWKVLNRLGMILMRLLKSIRINHRNRYTHGETLGNRP